MRGLWRRFSPFLALGGGFLVPVPGALAYCLPGYFDGAGHAYFVVALEQGASKTPATWPAELHAVVAAQGDEPRGEYELRNASDDEVFLVLEVRP